ncbi:hypothetical protein L1987_45444 [Smallanthus sonchifolius]|uniref:Uncharacterized protein n=1 Tax=Smallanthus sonchifolius TaxID=185202 RepID=A0ACB9FX32_9ASTR|nr:hypothetical protein L1987_45444 [Smallanthus sonchifolius]
MDEGIRKPGTDPGILLRLSEQFLRRRHFDDCRKYALQAHQLNPNFPGVAEILAVADVLLNSKHQTPTGTLRDWYAVMQLDRYSPDSNLIKQRFNHLYGLLNPSHNKLPFADEAFDIVCDAWYVLSNPVKKLEFDDLLKKVVNDFDFTFWTACPYCYYLYEYPKVYMEQCLRCPNEKCLKAFTCVEIDRPPVEVLTVGKYICAGFLPVGFRNGCWNPFVPLVKQKVNCSDETDKFVEISDDEIEIERDEKNNGGVGGLKIMEVDESVKKANVRKKSVAKNTKKATGSGNRVRKQGFGDPEKIGDCEFF